MVAKANRKRLTLPLAPVVGAVAGGATALMIAIIPRDRLGDIVSATGIPAIIAAAEPPLELNARLMLMVGVGGLLAVLVWFALFLLVGSRTLALGGDGDVKGDSETDAPVPVLRRADAHPDAPPRRPVFANRDLGTPFLDIHAPPVGPDELLADMPVDQRPLPLKRQPQAIPVDLDQPMANFDPVAARAAGYAPPPWAPQPVPLRGANATPSPPSAPDLSPIAIRRPVFEPGERMETFDLPPAPPPDPTLAPPRPARDPAATQASITALLERLEQGVAHRAERSAVRNDGLQDTLGTLRRMATRG